MQHLVHDHAERLEASILIEAADRRHRVRRAARRRRAGTIEGDGAVISAAARDGNDETVIAEKVGPVTREVERIIGLDAAAFQRLGRNRRHSRNAAQPDNNRPALPGRPHRRGDETVPANDATIAVGRSRCHRPPPAATGAGGGGRGRAAPTEIC